MPKASQLFAMASYPTAFKLSVAEGAIIDHHAFQ
jgi:hypothetical protein